MSRLYELTLLFRPDIMSEDIESALQNIKNIISSSDNCSIVYSEFWGLRNLEYSIKKNESAFFYHIRYSGNSEILSNLNERLSISDLIIRFLNIRIEDDEVNDISMNAKISNEGIIFDEKYKNVLNVLKNA